MIISIKLSILYKLIFDREWRSGNAKGQRRRKQFPSGVAKNSSLSMIPGDEGQRVFFVLEKFLSTGGGVQMNIFYKFCHCPPKLVWRNHTPATPLLKLVCDRHISHPISGAPARLDSW